MRHRPRLISIFTALLAFFVATNGASAHLLNPSDQMTSREPSGLLGDVAPASILDAPAVEIVGAALDIEPDFLEESSPSESIADLVETAGDAVAEVTESAPDAIGDAIQDPIGDDPITEVVVDVADPVLDAVRTVADETAPVTEAVADTVDPVVEAVDPLLEAVADVTEPLVESVADASLPIVEATGPVLDLVDPVVEALEPVIDVVEGAVQPIVGALEPIVEVIEYVVEPVLDEGDPALEPVENVTAIVIEVIEEPAGDIVGPAFDPVPELPALRVTPDAVGNAPVPAEASLKFGGPTAKERPMPAIDLLPDPSLNVVETAQTPSAGPSPVVPAPEPRHEYPAIGESVGASPFDGPADAPAAPQPTITDDVILLVPALPGQRETEPRPAGTTQAPWSMASPPATDRESEVATKAPESASSSEGQTPPGSMLPIVLAAPPDLLAPGAASPAVSRVATYGSGGIAGLFDKLLDSPRVPAPATSWSVVSGASSGLAAVALTALLVLQLWARGAITFGLPAVPSSTSRTVPRPPG